MIFRERLHYIFNTSVQETKSVGTIEYHVEFRNIRIYICNHYSQAHTAISC